MYKTNKTPGFLGNPSVSDGKEFCLFVLSV